MNYILTVETAHTQMSKAGNKAFSLFDMQRHGFPVPRWIAVSEQLLDDFLQQSAIGTEIRNLLDTKDEAELEHVANRISALFRKNPPMHFILEHIGHALDTFKGAVAVRSSGREEDAEAKSFAGQFDSFLNVQGRNDIAEAIGKCWLSVFSMRSLLYRHKLGLPLKDINMAVIVQEMVNAQKSGVAFTVNPSTSDTNEILISSVYGLGEALVSGEVDADTYYIDKSTFAIRQKHIGLKEKGLFSDGYVALSEQLRASESLQKAELDLLCQLFLGIEVYKNCPQDIEWAMVDGLVYVLQSRPVTAINGQTHKVPLSAEDIHIWDNSNVVENYADISLPLTYSFTRYAYTGAFQNYFEAMGMPQKQMVYIKQFLPNLMGHLKGRIYYDLLNWYRVSGVVPFGRQSQAMMETMMGVSEELNLKQAQKLTQAYHTDSKLESWLLRTRINLNYLSVFLRFSPVVKSFKCYFDSVYLPAAARDLSQLSSYQLLKVHQSFMQKLLLRWGDTIFLESIIALSFGAIQALTKRWIKDAPPWFEIAVIGNIATLESHKPIEAINQIAKLFNEELNSQELLAEEDEKVLGVLRQKGSAALNRLVDQYINEYGYRAADELKLESVDLYANQSAIIPMIRTSIMAAGTQSNTNQVDDLQQLLKSRLNPFKRLVFNLVRQVAIRAISSREVVRLCRTKTFGFTRKIFNEIGKRFSTQKVIDKASDIHYLRFEEITDFITGASSDNDIKARIQSRKKDFSVYQDIKLPSRLVTKDAVITEMSERVFERAIVKKLEVGGSIKGITCSPGNVTDTVQIVKQPHEFKGSILATYRTDPGWVTAFPGARAILVERGSPLTHASIVARELNIPTIVQIPDLLQSITQGDRINVNADKGIVTRLEN